MGRIAEFREKFEDIIEEVLDGDLCKIDTHELGEVVDMLKDMCQAEYYRTVVCSMETKDTEVSSEVRSRMYYHDPEIETVEEVETIINNIATGLDASEKSKMKQQLLTTVSKL